MTSWLATLLMIAPLTTTLTNPAIDLSEAFHRTIRPPRQRSLLEFARQEIVVPTGDKKGKWKPDTQPWTEVLFREIDSGNWPTVVTTGPSQSGKTQACFAIPTIYTIAELAENFVLGVPDEDMADKKWRTDLLPIMKASPRLRDLIPADGPGSRGGKVRDTIQFRNGVVAAIMTRGAGDAAKAGFTARVINVTEAADWSQGTETSQEADPLRQLRARQRSYTRMRRRLLVEGTVKIEEWLPWKLRGEEGGPLISSMSRLVTPCPHCGGWISPEREHFVGWQDAASEDQACNEATFICPLCAAVLTEEDRRRANRDLRIVHHGQTIDEHGEVHGDKPPVSTLWFRYSQWHNLLLTAADLAEDEWKASQLPEGTQDRDDAERELCQFQWCVPFVSTLADNDPIKPEAIRRRTDTWRRNELPDDTKAVTIGVDIGDWTAHWAAIAWRANGTRHVVAHGRFDVKRSKSDEVGTRIVASLLEFAEGVVEPGFLKAGQGEPVLADRVWIDGGYMPDCVAAFVRQMGTYRRNRYRLCRGRGKSVTHGNKATFNQPRRVTQTHPTLGREWYVDVNYDRRIKEYTFNADYWKMNVHEGLRADAGAIGAITLFQADDKNEHAKFSHHLANEQFKRTWESGKGFVDEWVQTGENHWLDCMAMASAAGDEVGVVLAPVPTAPEEPTEPEEVNWYAAAMES